MGSMIARVTYALLIAALGADYAEPLVQFIRWIVLSCTSAIYR
jgi:hypothetical protein